MNLFRTLLFFQVTNGLVLKSTRLHILDKSHVKNYADNWIHIWREKPDPLSISRINEAWKSIILCGHNKRKDNVYCLSVDMHMFLIFVREDETKKSLEVLGLLENPDNVYKSNQMNDLHDELETLSTDSGCNLDLEPMKKWGHGFYFYDADHHIAEQEPQMPFSDSEASRQANAQAEARRREYM